MQITEQFLEQCASEYFNGFNQKGIYHFQRCSFEQFVNEQKVEIERQVMK